MASSEKTESQSQPEASGHCSLEGLPAVRDHVPIRVWLVSAVIFLERASYYAALAPFQNYLQNPLHDSVRPGALGLGQSKAVMIFYIWLMFNYVTPLAGALLADCWFGRVRTIQIGLVMYIVALAIIAGTAFSEETYQVGGLPGFIVGAFLFGLAVGLVKPNMAVFMADQCPETEPRVVVLKNGKAAATSRDLTIQYIYNVNYWMVNVGGLSGIATTVTEKIKGFGFAFLISLCLIVASAILFHSGLRGYITCAPSGNIIPTAVKVLFRRAPNDLRPEHAGVANEAPTRQTDFEDDGVLIAEMKAAVRSCRVFIPFAALMLGADLMENGLVAQAGEMQTNGLPNDIMYNLNPIAVMVLLPFVQGWLYPFLAKKKINFTPEQRIVVGLFCSAVAVGYSAGIQHLIYKSGPCFDRPLKCADGVGPNAVNVGLQTPTYVFFSLAEILAFVAGSELAYSRAPASMRSIVQAIYMFFGAVGSAMGVGVSFAAEDPNMVIVYGSISGLLVLTMVAFALITISRRSS